MACYDNNQNSRLDAGDALLLMRSPGRIAPGFKVQLLVGESIAGTVRELPG